MPAVPHIETRGEQPYVAIRARVTMAGLGGLGGRFGEVFGWLAARGLADAGAPFFRYNVIDMARELEIYLTDPSQEPDMTKWETQLAFKLAD